MAEIVDILGHQKLQMWIFSLNEQADKEIFSGNSIAPDAFGTTVCDFCTSWVNQGDANTEQRKLSADLTYKFSHSKVAFNLSKNNALLLLLPLFLF